jgi:putative ABC transport system substrate-binding protein
MKRREALAALLALGAAAPPLRPGAQPRGAPLRVGILILASLPSVAAIIEGFKSGLRDLGYVEGRTVAIEVLSAEGDADRLPGLAAQFVARKVDVIVTGGGNVSTLAARDATSTIPIVMMSSIGAVEAGLVASLARPGGNVTGLTVPEDLGFKQIELLRELIPGLSRLAILVRHDPARSEPRRQAKALAQQLLLVALEFVEVRAPDDLARALEATRAAKPNAVIVAPDPLLYQRRGDILRFMRSARIPDMYSFPDMVEDGGLIAYSPNAKDIYGGVVRFVDRILKGAKPADLPVEQPTRFDLLINLGTAKALGLKVPQPLLLRAERVIP